MDRDAIRTLFDKLGTDTDAFFARVADDVDWTVEGTHPLAGRYRGKQAFVAGTFAKLGQVLPDGAQLKVRGVLVDGDWAVVELSSDVTSRSGFHFDNRYCWLCRFSGNTIVEVRAYLDSAMVADLFRHDPV